MRLIDAILCGGAGAVIVTVLVLVVLTLHEAGRPGVPMQTEEESEAVADYFNLILARSALVGFLAGCTAFLSGC